jgi:hypothetical protein
MIYEAQRRCYSAYQTMAILATAMQEGSLSPRAASLNKLWVSIFQQDPEPGDRRVLQLA